MTKIHKDILMQRKIMWEIFFVELTVTCSGVHCVCSIEIVDTRGESTMIVSALYNLQQITRWFKLTVKVFQNIFKMYSSVLFSILNSVFIKS